MTARSNQRGVALVMVMWFVAAMAILVGGILASGKIDRQGTDAGVFSAKASALGDGAIKIGLAEFVAAAGEQQSQFKAQSIMIGEEQVLLKITNGAALVNLNSAPIEVMSQLLAQSSDLDPAEAQMMAEKTIAWREGLDRFENDIGRPRQFLALEEILLVPGMSRATFDSVRDLACACEPSGATISGEQMAPLVAARDQMNDLSATGEIADKANLGAALEAEPTGSDVYRVDALINLGNRRYLRRHWVLLGSAPQSRLGFQSVQTEAIRILGKS